jgi:hypothetical protein
MRTKPFSFYTVRDQKLLCLELTNHVFDVWSKRMPFTTESPIYCMRLHILIG